jgi:hypothetical protein
VLGTIALSSCRGADMGCLTFSCIYLFRKARVRIQRLETMPSRRFCFECVQGSFILLRPIAISSHRGADLGCLTFGCMYPFKNVLVQFEGSKFDIMSGFFEFVQGYPAWLRPVAISSCRRSSLGCLAFSYIFPNRKARALNRRFKSLTLRLQLLGYVRGTC